MGTDLESVLRKHLAANADSDDKVVVRVWHNNENRIVMDVYPAAGGLFMFTVFGNNVAEYVPPAPPGGKPPTQGVTIPGIDSFIPMGGRK